MVKRTGIPFFCTSAVYHSQVACMAGEKRGGGEGGGEGGEGEGEGEGEREGEGENAKAR